MKQLAALFGLAVLLLVGALFYQHQQTAKLDASLAAMAKDRDAMGSELQKLNGVVADLQRRATIAATAAGIPGRRRARR